MPSEAARMHHWLGGLYLPMRGRFQAVSDPTFESISYE